MKSGLFRQYFTNASKLVTREIIQPWWRIDRSLSISPSLRHTSTQPNALLFLWLPNSLCLYSLFRHTAFTMYTARFGVDYYSEAIKSQFGVGRLSGHLKGHGTRRIVGCIEMDGAAKAEPASLAWKCACKILGVATNLRRCPRRNIDARPIVSRELSNASCELEEERSSSISNASDLGFSVFMITELPSGGPITRWVSHRLYVCNINTSRHELFWTGKPMFIVPNLPFIRTFSLLELGTLNVLT